jgi:thiol-disulfide isomerase/thioredoxin
MLGIATTDAAAAAAEPPPFYGGGAQFVYLSPLRLAGPMPLVTIDGRGSDLSALVGTVTLVNLWASWCAPCVAELPALDRLQGLLGGEGLKVVAISVDGVGAWQAHALIDRLHLRSAMVSFDPASHAKHAGDLGGAAGPFPLYALPITYLIDRRGYLVGYFPGAAAWDSAPAIAFLRHYLGRN